MKLYESVCILHPSKTDEETGKVIEKMKGILERSGATIVKVDNESKKKLAYEIQHERRGTFVTMQFQAEGTVVNELERFPPYGRFRHEIYDRTSSSRSASG